MDNRNSVPKKQWKKWSKKQKQMFNDVYEVMMDNPEFYMHPDVWEPVRTVYNTPQSFQNWLTNFWAVTAWNAAWIAADFRKLS